MSMITGRMLALVALTCSISSHAASLGDGSCQRLERVCVDGPGTKFISGYPVTRDCWKYQSLFQCNSGSIMQNDCQPLVDQGCGLIGSACIDYLDDGTTCSLYERTYQCKIADGGTSTVMDCGGQTYCMDGKCLDASYQPDGDFGQAITSLEVLRQAGVYLDENTLTLFNGTNSKCTVTLGIFNCCKSNTRGADMNNHSMTLELVLSGLKSFGAESIEYLGSTYVYDALFQSDAPNFLVAGWESIYGSGASDAFSPSVSYFGLTVGFGAPASSATVLLGNPGSFYVAFDPVTFAVQIAAYFIMELISCDQDEQILAMKRGQALCAKVGSYCSSKVLGVCVQKKESYCCYNSRLARLIAVEGRAQLAKPWGSPKNPDCGGFTKDEIAKIDFSRIDFSEVISDIKPDVKTPDFAIDRATTKINSYYSTP